MRRTVSSPDETLRGELKIRRAAEYFLTSVNVFLLVMKHRVECLILLLKQMILEGEIKHAKFSSFSSHFQTLIKLFVFSLRIINEFEK